jgi:hypothetical protein
VGLFKAAFRLTSRGADYRIEQALGKRAMVYQRIPPNGRGKIQLPLSGLTRDIEAVAEKGVSVPSFADVEVLEVVDARTVKVKPIA